MPISEQIPSLQAQRRQYVNFAFYKVDPAWRFTCIRKSLKEMLDTLGG